MLFFEYIISKGFELERGLPVEETGAKHDKMLQIYYFFVIFNKFCNKYVIT